MEKHPDDCYCADCVSNLNKDEEEQQRQEEQAEQIEGAGFPLGS